MVFRAGFAIGNEGLDRPIASIIPAPAFGDSVLNGLVRSGTVTPGRKKLAQIFAADRQVVVWWGCAVEAESALARLQRDGSLPAHRKALEILATLEAAWIEVNASDPLRQLARRLLRVHAIRSADALQLAAALTASGSDPRSLPFVSRDELLVEAAAKEGFAVL